MRAITFQRHFVMHPAGSCLAAFGDTKVICTASISERVPPWLAGKGKGWISAEYAMLPGSTNSRKGRDRGGRTDGRSVEIQRLIGRSLRAAVDLDSLGEVAITVDCDVLQADGGTRTTAISGGYVALVDALEEVARLRGETRGAAAYLTGQVAAVSVGIVAGEVVCDLDYFHDSRADVDMNVVMRDGDFVEVQGTGEQGVFTRAQMDALLDSAAAGIDEIRLAQNAALAL